MCGILGLSLLTLSAIYILPGRPSSLLGAIPTVVFGLLFLIPAFGAKPPGPNPDLEKIYARYRRARWASVLGVLGGFLGLWSLHSLDRSYPPGSLADTTFGKPLQIFFSVVFFGGLVSSFFLEYYYALARRVVPEEGEDEDDVDESDEAGVR